MKINNLNSYCFISREYPSETGFGGIGTHVWHMARALSRQRIKVTIFSYSENKNKLYYEDKIKIIRIKIEKFNLIKWWLAVTIFLIKNKFDIVEDGEFLASTFWYQLLFKRKKEYFHIKLHTCHRIVNYYEDKFTLFQKLKTFIINFIEKENTKRANLITSPSIIIKQLTGILWNIPEERIKILPYTFEVTVDENSIKKIGGNYMLYFGRLQERKGADLMLQMIKDDFLKDSNFDFILIGRDCYNFKNKLSLINNETAKKVKIIDHIVDKILLFSYIKSAKFVFLPSKFESFGLTTLEALWFNKNTFILNNSGPCEQMLALGLHNNILNESLIFDNKLFSFPNNIYERSIDIKMIKQKIVNSYGYNKTFIELCNIIKIDAKDHDLEEMSRIFRKKIFECKNYQERMIYTSDHFKELEKIALTNKGVLGFNRRILKLINTNLSNKRILLFGTSYEEIKTFCKLAKKVYFITIPRLEGVVLPKNTYQLEYDKKFNIKNIDEVLFDYIFSNHVIEHIIQEDLSRHFKEMYNLLQPGGEYFIICPSKHNIVRAPIEFYNYHIGQYTYSSISFLARKAGFYSYRPIVNPYILNYFFKYNDYYHEDFLSKLPNILLSIFGLNSLYIILKKM